MRKKVTFTKLEAAKAQTETAIKLFFFDECPASVHTLCSAAHRVLYDISKQSNTEFHFEMDVRIKEEHLKEWRAKVNEPSNFLKHADKDPEGVLNFEESINEMKIIQCCWGYSEISKSSTEVMDAFVNWMALYYPDIFKFDDSKREQIKAMFELFKIDPNDRERSLLAGQLLLKQKGLLDNYSQ